MPSLKAENLKEHRSLVREQLVDAFAECLEKHSFVSMTVANVAAAAGVVRSSVYRYFPDKASILVAYVERLGAEAVEAIEAAVAEESPSREETLARGITAALDHCLSPRARAAHTALAMLDGPTRLAAHAALLPIGTRLARIVDPNCAAGRMPLQETDDLPAILASVIVGAGSFVDIDVDVYRLAGLIGRGVMAPGVIVPRTPPEANASVHANSAADARSGAPVRETRVRAKRGPRTTAGAPRKGARKD